MKKVTIEQVVEAVQADDSLGFCLACGAEACGVEPDARGYSCEECNAPKVYGAEELLLMLA
jgi:hypothetical protein